jgi:ribosomal protein S18 acetylase RimI-like enzyme
MKIMERTFSGDTDLQRMAELVRKFPTENIHIVDLPYRFSSWSFDYPENIRLWTDENGQLLAWAILQVPFWKIDYAYHPEFQHTLHPQILKWADEQAGKIVGTPSGHPAWFVPVLASQTDRIRDLEETGFTSQDNVGENSWTQVLLQHSSPLSTKEISLPTGFTIRPLDGAKEVDAYVDLHRAVFESKNMTTEWRNRTFQRPEYIPDLDLIAVSPNGQLAAFCVCWLAEDPNGEISGQIEPMGVHAEYRKLGLGRAILSEGLRRLQSRGARQIFVQTDNYRDAAFKLYESAGFRVIKNMLMYRKNYEPAIGR